MFRTEICFGFSTVLKDCHATYIQLQPDIDVILKKIILQTVLDCVFMMDSKCFTSPSLSIPTALLLMVIKKKKREKKINSINHGIRIENWIYTKTWKFQHRDTKASFSSCLTMQLVKSPCSGFCC